MKPTTLVLCAGVCLFIATGCVSPRDSAWKTKRPLGSAINTYQPPSAVTEADTSDANGPVTSSAITLREALSLALLHNPDLRVFAWEVRAREAHALQEGLLPNPEVNTDVEDFAGTGSLRGFDATEATVSLSQLIELGGDRRKRRRVANIEGELAGWNFEAARLDVLTMTAQAFIGVLAAQDRLVLADSLTAQAQQFYHSVAARVEAGKVSSLEERRALVLLSMTKIAYETSVQELATARARLAATWGSAAQTFDQAVGDLTSTEVVPPFERLELFIERNPDVARWRDEMALRRADLALEKAEGIPNPVFSIGTRRIRELDETALATGISIALPLFDRNQGAVREAKSRIRQGEEAKRSATVRALGMLADAYGQLSSAYNSVTTLQRDVLPAAQENFDATQEGYLEGKFDLLMVLDAQRTLFETTNQYIDSMVDYHTAYADVERLIGTPLSEI